MAKAYLFVRLDVACEPGTYVIKLARDSQEIDHEGNLYFTFIVDDSTRTHTKITSLATTPAKTIKVRAKGFTRPGY